MAYTLAQSITEVRRLLNEETPSYWSDTQITSWIKQGCLEWCEKSLLYLQNDTITLASGTKAYSAPTDAIRTIHAQYNDIALQRINWEVAYGHNAIKLSSSTVPKYYTDMYDGTTFKIYITPTPGAGEATDTVALTCAYRTDDITALPWEYQPKIFDFAAYKAKYYERQYMEGNIYYQSFINNVSFARMDGIERGIVPVEHFRRR